MSTLAFIVSPREDLNGAIEVIPTIDGVALTDLIHAFELRAGLETRAESYSGLIPKHFDFGPLDLHYLGTSPKRLDPKTVLLGCACGEWGCWPLLARITATTDNVTWTELEQPHRKARDYSAFGPFTFSRGAYQHALCELQAELDA